MTVTLIYVTNQTVRMLAELAVYGTLYGTQRSGTGAFETQITGTPRSGYTYISQGFCSRCSTPIQMLYVPDVIANAGAFCTVCWTDINEIGNLQLASLVQEPS